MPEARSSEPYISHLVVTQRRTMVQVPTDYQDQQGNRLYQNMEQTPGIRCEITPYLTPTIKGPAETYQFPLRSYWESGITFLESKQSRSPEEEAALLRLKAYVESPDMIWAEDVLESEQLGDFTSLWRDAFSDVLDIFPAWAEQSSGGSGLPLHILPLQWECRVPFESAKSVNVNIGVYASNDGVADESKRPEQHVLSFEDGATRTQRETYNTQIAERIAQLTATIAGLTAEIAALPEGAAKVAKVAEKKQAEDEKKSRDTELAQRQAVTNGLIGQLIALPSIQTSLPKLSLAIIMALSEKEGWGLDKKATATKLMQTLGALAQA